MDEKALSTAIIELRKRKAHLDQVINMLETLETGKPRRGRPPKFLSQVMKVAEDATTKGSGAKKSKKGKKRRALKSPTG